MAIREAELREQVDQQAIEHIFRQMPSVWLGGMLSGGIFIAALWYTAHSSALLLWYGALAISLAYRFYLTMRYFRVSTRQMPAQHWGRLLVRTSLYQGVLWGASALLFFDPSSTTNQVVVICFVLAVSIASVPISSYWISAFFAYTLTATGLLALRLFMVGEVEYVMLGLAIIIYNFVVASFAWGVSKTLRDAVRLRFENLDLVEELSQANQSKSRFLAAASHDLRQPVHSLALFTESLKPEVETPRGQALLDHISNTLDAHNRLLNSLLDISKLDAGAIEPQVSQFSLKPLLDQLYNEMRPSAEEQGLLLYVRPCDHYVQSDPTLLGNILRNLIANAIRYTEEGWVLVACRARGDRLLLQVWDSGCGIAEQDQEAVFQEFRQLNNSERDRSKGLGLGLAICRRLAAMLGHELNLLSRPGRGSVFSLSLPRGTAQNIHTAAETVLPGQWDISGRTILVIDDELSVLQAMSALLQRWGCEVLLADGIDTAVEAAIKAGHVDAIVSDYRLRDETNGVQAIAAVVHQSGQPIPAMLVTGDTDPQRLLEAGESGYVLLHKPVQPAQLRAALGKTLRDGA